MESIDHIDEATRDLMFEFKARGIGIGNIARTFNESREVVEAVIDVENRRRPNPFDQDPVDLIHEHVIRIDALNEDSATLVRKESGAVRAAGLALQFRLAEHRLLLFQAIGVLPPADKVRNWASGIELANRMIDLLGDRGLLNEELWREIESRFQTTRENPVVENEQA